jgi:hypothetical protein
MREFEIRRRVCYASPACFAFARYSNGLKRFFDGIMNWNVKKAGKVVFNQACLDGEAIREIDAANGESATTLRR